MTDDFLSGDAATRDLDPYVFAQVPGLQYIAVSANRTLLEYAGGWADIAGQRAMTLDTTLMAYSMTKTFTAVAILQLAECGKLSLDDRIERDLPSSPYAGRGITLRQLLNHTAGIPNPIPLRWVHLGQEHASFDEAAALAAVLRSNLDLANAPGDKYAYSHIGYWLLGMIIEELSGQSYVSYFRANILEPPGLSAREMDFVVTDESRHATGYLAKCSVMNLVKGFVVDRKFLRDYEGRWLGFRRHYVNGPALAD